MPDSKTPPPPNPAFHAVYPTTEMMDAMAIKVLLESHGIETSIENENSGFSAIGMPTTAAPFIVTVPTADAPEAEKIIAAAPRPKSTSSNRKWWILLLVFEVAAAILAVFLAL